ncbi:MAG TPA: hypothetical protein VGM82_10890 [Gemmatimonadaceae bacterium]|jgi:uncharacterized membrane protein YphA (DoxX/SURF4 family)
MPTSRAIAENEVAPAWHPATRAAFRFCFVYFGLYVITTQTFEAFVLVPGVSLPELGTLAPVRPLFLWIGRRLLGLTLPDPCCTTATGDNVFGWVTVFSLLLIALVATIVWSVVARRRTEHVRLYGWFRLILRVAVGVSFLYYGFAKVIPLQMPTLDLERLVEPFGHFSPMGVLWASVGASPAYEVAIGSAEVLGGLLLFFPATTLVGALICMMDGTMVFLMNMTYDVNVKLLSFHLVLMSLVLIAPNVRPLLDLLILHRVGALRRTFQRYVATIDSATTSLTLADSGAKAKSTLTYDRVDPEHLIIDGAFEGQQIHLALSRRDPDSFLLRRRGFHWVSEVPFNR